MSGSRLGRGRGGRLAVYGGCGVVVLLLIVFYRAATSEMARLRELHVQCAHQQEALAAQLQVIFEYKVRLEKSLAEEKSSNVAVKQELQQRASREKTLRDKDSVEATQRFNSLQQTFKLLQTEHKDLQEECKKREKQALEDSSRLETTLQDLRSRIKQAREDKEKALEHLKNKYLEIDTEKTKLEEKYNEMVRSSANTASTIDHLNKEIFQLKRELEEAKKSFNKMTSAPNPPSPPRSPQEAEHPVSAKSGGSSQQQQNRGPSSSMKSIPTVKMETGTVSVNQASTGPQGGKLASKMKIPIGVLPIPVIIDPKLDNREDKPESRKEEQPRPKNVPPNPESKEQRDQVVEPGILDPPFQAHADEQIVARRGNGDWVGVQEIGEDLNHGQLPGLDGDQRVEAGDEHYDTDDYDQGPQQKNSDLHLVESEAEGEDEDDQV